ncbi:hypothetical protein [Achromobacter insuavis]|uniref:hypothetical protein n=1 Tax=Achromobacter insuavis TaxID=1287735 RepID=UPI001F12D446|nr:hypothetical protein [Achromobacter insuavis]
MPNPQSRLLALAAEAKQQYLAECAAGGEPAYPAWIEDALAVCGGGQYDTAAPGISTVEDASFPAGAIVNGRTLADRLEAYPFQSEGGDLRLCADWVEFRRCFEYLAEWVGRPAPAAGDALDAARYRWLREMKTDFGHSAQHHDLGKETIWLRFSGYGRNVDAAIDAAIAAQRKGDA